MKHLYSVTFVHLFASSQAILDYLRWTTIKAFFWNINNNFYKNTEII